jgi:hypothetical protein
MSKRPTPDDRSAEAPNEPRPPAGKLRHVRSRVGADLLLIFGSFVLASALAGALGAVNLGTALSFGQIALAIAVVYVLLRR